MKNTGQLAVLLLGTAGLFWPTTTVAADRVRDDFAFTYHIEVAGGDASDIATDKQLRDSGAGQVPAQPSASSRDPLKPAQPATSGTAADAPAAGAQQTAPASEKPAEADPAKTATDGTGTTFISPYVRVDAGYTVTGDPEGSGANGTHRSDEIENTGLAGIGLGAHIGDQLRMEGMLTYRWSMSIDGTDGAGNTLSGDVESASAMFNLYYDIKQAHEWLGDDTVTPYVGGGVGVSMLDTDTLRNSAGTSENGTRSFNLSYAAMAGVATKLSDSLILDFGYQFIDLGEFGQDGATGYDDLKAHEVRAGLRLQF
jgi:opacity protein-like surface antigen